MSARIKLLAVPNTPEGIAKIADLKSSMKYMSKHGPVNYHIRIYGRCHDRKGAFAQTGRQYRGGGGNYNSIYSLKSKQAPFCYEWAVYLETDVKKGITVVCDHVAKNTDDGFKSCKICGAYMI